MSSKKKLRGIFKVEKEISLTSEDERDKIKKSQKKDLDTAQKQARLSGRKTRPFFLLVPDAYETYCATASSLGAKGQSTGILVSA